MIIYLELNELEDKMKEHSIMQVVHMGSTTNLIHPHCSQDVHHTQHEAWPRRSNFIYTDYRILSRYLEQLKDTLHAAVTEPEPPSCRGVTLFHTLPCKA